MRPIRHLGQEALRRRRRLDPLLWLLYGGAFLLGAFTGLVLHGTVGR